MDIEVKLNEQQIRAAIRAYMSSEIPGYIVSKVDIKTRSSPVDGYHPASSSANAVVLLVKKTGDI